MESFHTNLFLSYPPLCRLFIFMEQEIQKLKDRIYILESVIEDIFDCFIDDSGILSEDTIAGLKDVRKNFSKLTNDEI